MDLKFILQVFGDFLLIAGIFNLIKTGLKIRRNNLLYKIISKVLCVAYETDNEEFKYEVFSKIPNDIDRIKTFYNANLNSTQPIDMESVFSEYVANYIKNYDRVKKESYYEN